MRKLGRVAFMSGIMLLLLTTANVALAQEAADVELDSPIRGLEIDQTEERVDLDINLFNRADTRRIVSFVLEEVPEGWDVAVWNRLFRFRLTEFVVEPTALDPDRRQEARIRIRPGTPEPGEYSFTLRVVSQDGTIEYDSARFTIRVREGDPVEEGVLSMRTDLPVLRGAPGETLGFEVVIRNDTGEEDSFSLSAQPPEGWQVTFRERTGDRRVIGAVSVPDNLTERIRVDVRVPVGAALGQYEIPLATSGTRGHAELALLAELVGRGELRSDTPTGRLNIEATAGGRGTGVIRLTNIGTDRLENVRLRAEAPRDWTVEFGVPDDTVAALPANTQIEVPVTVMPPGDAISGDYIVTVRAETTGTNARLDYRVTVTQSTIWGWLGVGLVVLVVGGMVGLFFRLGRR